MEKMKCESPDLTQANIARLAELFPSVVTEARGHDGKLKKAVNFEALRQLLSSEILDGDEAYEFTWVGKKAAIVEAGRPIRKTLRPCPQESKNWDSTENLYIEGDNLAVLKLLQENYLGKIKMIYIDPPYNTGNDFIYRDNFAMDPDEYQEQSGEIVEAEDGEKQRLFRNTDSNGRFHSDWCSMIYPRLMLARNLLSENGVIFISCDDNEQSNLKNICDEVLGEENLAACIPWQSRLSIQNDTDFSINHEYILCYAKKRRFENRRLKEANVTKWYNKDSFVFRPIPLDQTKFDNPDNDPRGAWKADPFDAPNVRPNLTYPIINPSTGEIHLPPPGRHWRIAQDKYEEALQDSRVIFGKNGTGRPQMKSFYNEKKDFGSIDNSWFSADKVGTTTQATKELQAYFDNTPFDTPKPVQLIKKLCVLSFLNSEDIILDFFSGSATTAHAVMQLNAEDGGRRKFIMAQLPEACGPDTAAAKAGYKNICEIGKERIRRAGEKIRKDNADKPGIANLDIGFRVLKCDSSNMKDVYYTPGDTGQGDLRNLIDNIKEDRTDLDLLFGCLLEWGLPLSLPYKTENICGYNVHFYDYAQSPEDNTELAACFAANISEEAIREIAKRKPLRALFRDAGFADSEGKINAVELFKNYAPDTDVRVI